MKYNSEVHHRRSIRLPGYDYGQTGLYFITICAWQRQCIFGAIEDGEMHLNPVGEIARDEWLRTAKMRRNIDIAEFVIMPNHVHGIIAIGNDPDVIDSVNANDFNNPDGRGTMHRAPTTESNDHGVPRNRTEKSGTPTSNRNPTIIDGSVNTNDFNNPNGRGTMHRAPTMAPNDHGAPRNRTEKSGTPTSNRNPTIIDGSVNANDFNNPNGRGTMHRAPTTESNDHGAPRNRTEKSGTPTSNRNPTIIDGSVNTNDFNNPDGRGTMHRAPTTESNDHGAPHNRTEKFGAPTSNTIPTIIRGYKAAVTTQVNILQQSPQCPVWQRNYYENVIRNEADYLRIANYILNNPRNWSEDSLHHRR